MSTKQERGKAGEEYTAELLTRRGYSVIERNFRRRGGEIDIIAEKGGELIFVEVKTRKFGSMTDGADAVDKAKQRRIIETALIFVNEKGLADRPMRFDISEVTVTTEKIPRVLEFNYYEDAFDASGLGIIF